MTSLNIGVFGARGIPSTYSGYETFLTTLLPELAARGHNVTMYCRRGEVDAPGDYLGVRRVVLPAIPGKQFNTLSHGALASIRSRFVKHDLVFAVNVANAGFCALHRYTGRPVVLNTDGQEWARGKWGRIGRAYFSLSARLAGRSATALVSDCTAMADIYSSQFSAESTVIPYCVPSRVAVTETGICERFDVVRNEFFVVAARLNPENNVDTLADAYSRTSLSLPLLVLGEANYRSPVANRLATVAARDPRIRVVGHVDDRAEFLDLLGAARSYLHGHSVGGMNPSLVEAMHAGALVAALETPFNRETLGDGGIYFDLADVGKVLGTVMALAPDRAAQIRECARERAADRFNVAEVVSAYELLFTTASRGSSRTPLALPTRWTQP